MIHGNLPCGIEYGIVPLPSRHVVAMQIRMLAGVACEPEAQPGLARLIEQNLDKGTEKRSGRELSDAFDAIGASASSAAGREATTFSCTILPEHFEQAVALHAEMLRTPTFPEDSHRVNIELTKQEMTALEDDPQSLTDKIIGEQAYGGVLGRHPLGTLESVDRMQREDLVSHWQRVFGAGRMVVSVSGRVSEQQVADVFTRHFEGFGVSEHAGRTAYDVNFRDGIVHHEKDTEQQQIGICWPGVEATDDRFPAQQVMLGILSGGMSGRLFTEVREKLSLCYWVGAWQETPRGYGMIFLGASTTPQRCDQTYAAMLREVDRLSEDLTQDELDRAVTGIQAQRETRGESTRARCVEMASDLFFYGKPISKEEKTAKIAAVGIKEVKDYLASVPRDRRCLVTLGPRSLEEIGAANQGIETSS
jgi:predicted Zn-dependent peptidase